MIPNLVRRQIPHNYGTTRKIIFKGLLVNLGNVLKDIQEYHPLLPHPDSAGGMVRASAVSASPDVEVYGDDAEKQDRRTFGFCPLWMLNNPKLSLSTFASYKREYGCLGGSLIQVTSQ